MATSNTAADQQIDSTREVDLHSFFMLLALVAAPFIAYFLGHYLDARFPPQLAVYDEYSGKTYPQIRLLSWLILPVAMGMSLAKNRASPALLGLLTFLVIRNGPSILAALIPGVSL